MRGMAAATRYNQRPRAPSPLGPSPIRSTGQHKDNFAYLRQQDDESDAHAYSTVDGPPTGPLAKRPPAVPPKNRIDRMFGDSVCNSEESSNEAAGKSLAQC